MSYKTDRTEQLVEAHKRSRFGQIASLQSAGVELPQHNANAGTKKPAKKAAKKTAKKAAKKSTAKKS